MKSTTSFLAMVAIAAGALLGAASGCELIAGVDHTKIGTGATGGSGGSGGTTGGGGTAGTTGGTAGTGPMCTDPTMDCPAPSGECKVPACDAGAWVDNDVKEGDPA